MKQLCKLSLLVAAIGVLAMPLSAMTDSGYILYHENDNGPEARHPLEANTTHLLDEDGQAVHSWDNELNAPEGAACYLRPDGLLLRTGSRLVYDELAGADFPPGAHGVVQLVDAAGNVVWEYEDCAINPETGIGISCLHHDVESMPNGNILVSAYEILTAGEAEALGWAAPDDGIERPHLWVDSIYELKPNLRDGSTAIVWEWHFTDHLIQDIDPEKPNYGVVAENPGKLDINFFDSYTAFLFPNRPPNQRLPGDHTHVNSIAYNMKRDEIILSGFSHSEFYIIDHNTKSAQAARFKGDFLYRWGNPQTYDAGTADDQITGRQHDVRWLVGENPGEARVTIHNNSYGELLEVVLPTDEKGGYMLAEGLAYGPEEPFHTWTSEFVTVFMGGAQKLPDGNILLTRSNRGELYKLDPM